MPRPDRNTGAISWLGRLTLETIIASAQDLSRVEEALDASLSYSIAPYCDEESEAIHCEFSNVLIESPSYSPYASVRETKPARRNVGTTISAAGEDRWGMQLVQRCDCGSWGRCLHAMSLLLDLAINPALREAISANTDSAPALRSQPQLRTAALETVIAQRAVREWMPITNTVARQPHDLLITVIAPPHTSGAALDTHSHATLELRFQNPRDRSLYDPALGHGALSTLDAQLASLGQPLSRRRKGISVSGIAASIALSLLRSRDTPAVVEGTRGMPISFSQTPLGLRFERTTVPRAMVKRATVVLGSPWQSHRTPHHGAKPTDPALSPTADALVARWISRDGTTALDAREAVLFNGPFPFVWVPSEATFHPVDPMVDLQIAVQAQRLPAVEIPQSAVGEFYRTLDKLIGGRGVRLPPPESMGLAPRETPTMVLRIEGSPLDLSAHLRAVYSFGEVSPHSPIETAGTTTAESEISWSGRNHTHESEAMARVRESGLRWSDDTRTWIARDDSAVAFWQHGLASLRQESEVPLTLFLADKLRGVTVRPPIKVRGSFRLVDKLLHSTLQFSTEELTADIADILSALSRKRRWVVLDDGSLAEINDSVAQLAEETQELFDKQTTDGVLSAKLSPHQLGRVTRWIDTGIETDTDPALEAFRAKLKALGVSTTPALPSELTATLRGYQSQGLAWLQFLHSLGVGGVLADDMGLGKTLTALALLQWRKETHGHGVSLVVAPTSVAPNWVHEAARFTPGLSVLLAHGSNRPRDVACLQKADVVVTTYALLRRDLKTLTSLRFRYVILDEAQCVKNSGAQTRQAASELDAEARLALTGTPVENRLGELWSIMDLCNPAMLGSATQFAATYDRAVANDPTGHAAEKLRALVRPFLLRRTKREVLSELPPKSEIDTVCVLGTRQRKLYDALASLLHREVRDKVKREGLAKNHLAVLTALLRLRQMACDPRLIDPQTPPTASTKREMFLDLVQSLADEGRRALVFSQFVELLTLWRQDLDRLGLRYEWLDGSTRDRDGAVQRFQSGTAPLFLISLKAGGTGLNLTAADTVIHCDPWWNPAVEDQATDRAHRIGQRRAVTVYRLIAKGTVEEKIQVMKSRKRAIADAIVGATSGEALRGLTAEDLELLLGASDADSV